MRPRTIAVWYRIAAIGYGVGDWAMGHVPGATPDEECRERMQARLDEAWADKYGMTQVTHTDEGQDA